ncbi:MAG: DUF4912 domain-containing protein [Planctomycetota bacterium]|nr:DUF4912 domain-containing protein [Planctomycetota bacterium]
MGKKKQLAERSVAQASKSPVGSVVSKLRVRLPKTSVKTDKEEDVEKPRKRPAKSKAATEVGKTKRAKAPALRLKKPARPAKPGKAVARLKPKPVAPAAPVPAAPPEPAAPVDQRGPDPLPASFIDRGAPIPDRYGYDRLVALVRDPQWIFGYWELTGGLMDRIVYARGHALIDASAWVLRLHRIDEECAIDMEIDPSIGNWYIHVGKPGRYQLELGLLTPEGEWISLLASNEIVTPAEGLSDRIDEEWRLRPEDEERLRLLLMKELGLEGEGLAKKRGGSDFVGASRLLSSWKLAGSWLGGSWGGSASGRPVAGSWAMSFQGASGRPSSGGSGGFMNVGWIVGADGRHEPVLVRPSRGGGPNWHFQSNLPAKKGPSKTDAAHFKVKLPRLLRRVERPKATWPPRTVFTPPISSPGKAATRAQTQGSSGKK